MTPRPSSLALTIALIAAPLAALGAARAPTASPPSTAPAASRAAAPTPGRAAGARGAARGTLTVTAPADAIAVAPAPPLDRTGNFKIAPLTTWANAAVINVNTNVPRGRVTTFTMKSQDTKMFPGINGPYERNVWVYIPAGYKEGTELPLMVAHDGAQGSAIQTILIALLDTYIPAKRLPPMAAVFIANGGDVQPRSERSLEYDTVSGKYAEYIENEVLPLAEKTARAKFSRDPDARGVIGQSSGGAAALAMAWFHNDWYHRVISYSGSFVNLKSTPDAPRGAWEYHANLIPQSDKKPLRIWLEVGSADLNPTSSEAGLRNWPLANNRLAEALKAKGYEYQYVWAEAAAHVEAGVECQTLPQAMEWLWKTYKAK